MAVLSVGYVLNSYISEVEDSEFRNNVIEKANELRIQLEDALVAELLLVKGVRIVIMAEPNMSQKRFTEVVKPLFKDSRAIRNIGAAPDMVISMIFPLKGNEAALGFNYLESSQQVDAAVKAKETGDVVMTGPLELVQGGLGIIARLPVYVEINNKRVFWGLISVVLDVDKIFRLVELNTLLDEFNIALQGTNGLGKGGEFFYGNDSILKTNPVSVPVKFPGGSWHIYMSPKSDWHEKGGLFQAVTMTILVISALVIFSVWLIGSNTLKRKKSEERLRALFDLSPIGIALNEFDTGRFIELNDALVRPTGYTREELLNIDYWALTPKDFLDQEKMMLSRLKQYGRYGPYEKEYVTKDGNAYPVLLNGVLFTDTSGKKFVWSIVEDLSQRRAYEAALKENADQLELIIDSTGVGIWDWYVQTGEVTFNERWAEMIGYTLEDLEPITIDTWLNLAHPDDLKLSAEALERHWQGQTSRYYSEARMKHRDGHWIWVLDTGKVVEWYSDGKPKRMIGTHIDITERKDIEQKLTKARDDAHAAAKAKSQFLASMSHEIRTPMNGIFGMLSLLKQTSLTKTQLHHTELAITSAQSLLHIINDILDFSKIEAGKLTFENISFNAVNLLSDIVNAMAYKAEEHSNQIILDTVDINHQILIGDPGRVRQVITNLYSNALKFTKDGTITLVASTKRVNERILFIFSIEDNGIGIEQSKLPLLFNAFTQEDASTTRRYGGTGLGLAIVKQLCELMDGKVEVTSKEGEGSRFTIELLLEEGKGVSYDKEKIQFSKVALFDKNTTQANNVKRQLSHWGLSVTVIDYPIKFEEVEKVGADILFFDESYLKKSVREENWKEKLSNLMNQCVIFSHIHSDFSNNEKNSGLYYIFKPITPQELWSAVTGKIEFIGNTNNKEQSNDGDDKIDSSHKLLIVEDNPVNQTVIKAILRKLNLDCELLNNGKKALEFMQAKKASDFSLILMDCQMPEMDGYETTRRIRKGDVGEEWASIPIIALTANAMKGDKEKCIDAGMNDYLPKPISLDDIQKTLKVWLSITKVSL
ncbi:PAS domain S-box protein [Pleionea sediminis]|uniref:PAS domain S-box protein n=1 Tax=Pleionea sediminis TaxID=2569479 RepID=UPI0013DD8A30|nr:PAS domain S-box protein [Pleionea sediminis]